MDTEGHATEALEYTRCAGIAILPKTSSQLSQLHVSI